MTPSDQRMSRRAILRGLAGGAALLGTGLPVASATAAAADAGPRCLPVRRPEPGLVEAELRARVRRIVVDGQPVTLWTYEGAFPGPELRVRAGERLRLTFRNDLPEASNLHYHGLHVPPTGRADNIWLHVPPGGRFTYEFDIPASEAGTFWYHPHVHGAIARQMWHGLSGPLIVEGGLDELPELQAADDRTLLLRDLEHVAGAPTPHTPLDWMQGKEGGPVLCNGSLAPRFRARASLVRLRLINASNAAYLRLGRDDGRPLHLIGTDGRALAKPRSVEDVLLTPAQRAEVLVDMPVDRAVTLRRLPYDRRAPYPGGRGVLARLQPPTEHKPVPVPETLLSQPAADPARASRRRRVRMAMFLLNGQPFNPNRIDARGRLGEVEIWEVSNVGTMDHPFHMHTWHFKPLTWNGRPWPVDCWRDTVNLRPGDTVELYVPLTDYTGKTVYHCHIAEHGDKGMMAVLDVR